MSSRTDHRRRDRSWEKDDKDRDRDRYSRGRDVRRGDRGGHHRDEPRRRSSRSRSPRRDRNDRRAPDRRQGDRDYRRDDDRRPDTRQDRDRERDRRPEERKRNDNPRDSRRDEKDTFGREERPTHEQVPKNSGPSRVDSEPPSQLDLLKKTSSEPARPNSESVDEDGEAMEEENDDDAAMTAMMGVTGFGTTKGKHVAGNQEGGANVKKVRTWRQYMNRRGGFNRPLDKIK